MSRKLKTFVQGFLVLTLSSVLAVQGAYAQRAKEDDKAPPANQIDQRTGEILTKAKALAQPANGGGE